MKKFALSFETGQNSSTFILFYYRHGLWFFFSMTLVHMFGPLVVCFVMESLTCNYRYTWYHIPILSIFIRLKLLTILKPLWAKLYEKREKIEKLDIAKIEEKKRRRNYNKTNRKLSKSAVSSDQIGSTIIRI